MTAWSDLVRKDPSVFADLIEALEGGDISELQVVLKISPKSDGQPTLIVGLEPEGFDPEDAELVASNGVGLIAAERRRQVRDEGFDATHDRHEPPNHLALAGAQYALPPHARTMSMVREGVPAQWPWPPKFWKPTPDDRLRELVKGGALIAAEIDRLLALGAERVAE